MHLGRALYVGLVWWAIGTAGAAQEATASLQQLAGTWEGTVGASRAARIRFTFSRDSTRMRGSFDALASGVLAWPVRVAYDNGKTLRLTLPNGWVFHGVVTDARISGTLDAQGQSAPFILRRAGNVPPPYSQEAVVFRNGGITLSGTVLTPRGNGPYAAVVFAHGSGAMDRTADNFLGDYLARRGVVVLLYDKRGVGQSSGEWRGAGLEELAADATAGVRLLRTRPGVDAHRVGVAGRSQGGQLAVLSAQRNSDVAFAINISGSLVPPWQQMNYEVAANMKRDGMSTQDSVLAQAIMNEKWTVARTGNGWDSLAAHVRRVRAEKPPWLRYVQLPDTLSDIRDSWEGQMGFDYGPVLSRFSKPILALFGGRDTSTPTDETVAVLRAGLRAAGNAQGTIRVYANADHALLIWRDGAAQMEFPSYPPEYPEIVARWIRDRK